MPPDAFAQLRDEIMLHPANRDFTESGHAPLFSASATAKIVIIGQAPGIKAQTNRKPWADASGLRLMRWLGVSEEQFRDTSIFAHMPMDFYYPGKGKSGDLPPRKDFAPLWHPRLLDLMPAVGLIVLVGGYAQKYYLQAARQPTLTATVAQYADYLPEYFPLVHPSPLNFRWFKQNMWFEAEVVPQLQQSVAAILNAAPDRAV